PNQQRGSEIATRKTEILIKGLASDPSGLNEVLVNGNAVYTQPDGNFWGSVMLSSGKNTVQIKAKDGAGNIAEKTFTINVGDDIPETRSVVNRNGTNYCMLIGAQNYDDETIISLDNPIQDAVKLKMILKKGYNFNDTNIISLF